MLAMSSLPLDDVQQICIVLGILYGVECIWWLRGNSFRLYTPPFTEWSEIPGDAPRVDAWRFGLANLLPWSESFAAESFPFPFDPVSLLLPIVDPVTGQERFEAMPFDSLEEITSSKRDVLVGTKTIGTFSSTAFAQTTASRLERLRSADNEKRLRVAEIILEELWDSQKARSHLTAWREATRYLRTLGGTLAILGLVAGPLVWGCRHGLPQTAPLILLSVCIVLWFAIAIMGMLIDTKCLPKESNLSVHRATAFLSPASAMRLFDTLGRDVLADFEPLVVSLVVGDERRVRPTVAVFLRDMLYPAGGPTVVATDEESQDTVDNTMGWFRTQMGLHARQTLRESGIGPDALLMQLAVEQGANAYCPRCSRQFTNAEGDCRFCAIPLAAFKQPYPRARLRSEA